MFGIGETKAQFKKLQRDVLEVFEKEEKSSKKESLIGFFSNIGYAVKLIFKEKEIIVFAALQLIVIGLGYYLWVQMLEWIPEDVWESAKNSDKGSPADIILLLWTFVCVGLVTYPLGLLSACMGAAHFLHSQGEESTVARCFKIVLSRAWPLWIFSWIDGWWTINRILERLPKKRDKTPALVKIRNEALYQAWKLATLGILPSLIVGRSVTEACKDSLGLLTNRFKQLIKLRLGYSGICWFFGIASYVGIFFMYPFINANLSGKTDVYTFYFFAGVPMLIALAFIQLIFRPVYIISACRIYSDYAKEKNIAIKLPEGPAKITGSIVAFCVFCLIIAGVYLYRDELGITKLLTVPYQ